jgi:hypothetical protein
MDNWEEKVGNGINVLNLAAHQHEGEGLPPHTPQAVAGPVGMKEGLVRPFKGPNDST